MKKSLHFLNCLIAILLLLTAGCAAKKSAIPNAKFVVITGTVHDSFNNQVLPGASITVKDKGVGSTDGKGTFRITVKRNDQLTFSFIGYLPQTIDVKMLAHDTINLLLIEYKIPPQPEVVIRGE